MALAFLNPIFGDLEGPFSRQNRKFYGISFSKSHKKRSVADGEHLNEKRELILPSTHKFMSTKLPLPVNTDGLILATSASNFWALAGIISNS